MFVLLRSNDGQYSFLPLEQESETGSIPEPRGWFAADATALPAAQGNGTRVYMHGGLNEQNERLGDAWSLDIV